MFVLSKIFPEKKNIIVLSPIANWEGDPIISLSPHSQYITAPA